MDWAACRAVDQRLNLLVIVIPFGPPFSACHFSYADIVSSCWLKPHSVCCLPNRCQELGVAETSVAADLWHSGRLQGAAPRSEPLGQPWQARSI